MEIKPVLPAHRARHKQRVRVPAFEFEVIHCRERVLKGDDVVWDLSLHEKSPEEEQIIRIIIHYQDWG